MYTKRVVEDGTDVNTRLEAFNGYVRVKVNNYKGRHQMEDGEAVQT